MRRLTSTATRLWNSPTFTTWVNLGSNSARFLLVTPLVLRNFDTTEIAAWYLFGSLTVFGTLIHARMSMTLGRMIAFAMAGVQDLSEMTKGKRERGDGQPHWPTLRRAYGTIGLLSLVTAVLTGLSGIVMGIFALNEMMSGYEHTDRIWTALLLMVGGQAVRLTFSQYSITLQNMGLVALVNRWSVFVTLLSTLSGFIVLINGYGIVELAMVMQGVMLISIVQMRSMLRKENDGALKNTRSICLDRQMIAWAWPPFWKGLLGTIANRGVTQFGSIIYARYAPVEAVAAYLFSLNILRTIMNFSEAPMISNGPRFSRLLAKGDSKSLQKELPKKCATSQWLFLLGCSGAGIVMPYLLAFIDSNADYLSPMPWAALTAVYMIQRYIFIGLRLPAMGNNIAFYLETLIAAGISFAGLALSVRYFGFYGLLAGMFLPYFVLINLRPHFLAAPMIEMHPWRYIVKTGGWVVPFYLLVQTGIIAVTPYLPPASSFFGANQNDSQLLDDSNSSSK